MFVPAHTVTIVRDEVPTTAPLTDSSSMEVVTEVESLFSTMDPNATR